MCNLELPISIVSIQSITTVSMATIMWLNESNLESKSLEACFCNLETKSIDYGSNSFIQDLFYPLYPYQD